MVEEIEGIYTELRVNPLGYMAVLRNREVHGARGWPEAVADRSVPNRTQLEPIHGVPVRVDPLEVSKAGVPAGLSRHQVGPLVPSTVADSSRIVDIRYASDDWRIGGPARDVDDRTKLPRTQRSPDIPLHVLQGAQVINHVAPKDICPLHSNRPLASSQIERVYDLTPGSIADMQ